jgi:hypothetical protein
MAVCAHSRGKFTEGRKDPKEGKRVLPMMNGKMLRHKENIQQRIRDNLESALVKPRPK